MKTNKFVKYITIMLSIGLLIAVSFAASLCQKELKQKKEVSVKFISPIKCVFAGTKLVNAFSANSMDFEKNIDVEETWGFQLTLKLRNDPQNIVIPIGDCELDGFRYDIFTEYKQPSVRRVAEKGNITA